jgi:plasmid stability protein
MEPFMGKNLSIKDVPDDELESIRAQAKSNHRSLQGELRRIISEAARRPRQKTITLDELAEHGRRLGLSTPDEATRWIREDRDR